MKRELKAYNWLVAHVGHTGEECLTWPFGCADGYAQVWDGQKVRKAHRVMCELVHGPAPTPGHLAAHDCGQGDRACVHPKHVFWKTPSENQKDRNVHGTHNRWAKRGKIGPNEVAEIKALQGGDLTQQQIADKYGVSRPHVSAIWRGISRNAKPHKGWIIYGGKYRARVIIRGVHFIVGDFDTPEKAHAAYLAENELVRAGTSKFLIGN